MSSTQKIEPILIFYGWVQYQYQMISEEVEQYHLRFVCKNLTELPPLEPDLEELDCSCNNLTHLPPLPPTLKRLYCCINMLQELPPLPEGLEKLICGNNNFTEFPPLPSTLLKLQYNGHTYGGTGGVRNIKCTIVPPLPDGLIDLSCSANNITELPAILSPNLQSLTCDENKLTVLPTVLPDSLTSLKCDINELTALPAKLPPNLTFLNCSYNKLTALPAKLPASLKFIDCSHNKITELPELPDTLKTLNVYGNPLLELPDLPMGLKGIHCFDEIKSPTLIGRYPLLPTMLTHFPTTLNGPSQMKMSINVIIDYINGINSTRRQHARTALIKSDIMRVYAERTMNPVNLLPLLDDANADVDAFMCEYVEGL